MPMRFRDLVAFLEAHGLTVEPGAGTSHWKVTKPGFRPYPIPCPNGLRSEIVDYYIKGVSKHFGIASALAPQKKKAASSDD